MRLRLFAIATIAVSLLTPTHGLARGSNERGTLPKVSAVIPPVLPYSPRLPSPNGIFGGCGTHRHYDSVMKKCRGPADF
jgi:hypothetical protein